jgi:hypothetical protein
MQIICVADLHGRWEKIHKLEGIKADLIVIAGDITNYGGEEKASEILKDFLSLGDVIAIPGNCDHFGVNRALVKAGIDVHSRGRVIGSVGFFGAGGSNATPFNTPQEYSEEEIGDFLLKGYLEIEGQKIKVMVSHSPPYDTAVDKTRAGVHAGSIKVRRFIEDYKPDFVICGHIHEAKGKDLVGGTHVINPGPFHMGYAKIGISDKLEITFHEL